MDLTQFIHLYGKHKVRVIDAKYNKLRLGDIILAGDEAWAWDIDGCKLGWMPVPKVYRYSKYTKDMVEIRRKDVTAFARPALNTIKLHTCPSCGNRFPKSQINCSACGHMMDHEIQSYTHTEYVANMIETKRKKSLKLHTCPSCRNMLPVTQINCGECGHTM